MKVKPRCPAVQRHTPHFSEERVDERRGFGAAEDDENSDQQQHNDDRSNEVSLVRQDEVEQFGDKGTAVRHKR